ncbi:Lysylphosphatidylglycerol synthase TM region [Cardinium endosymbiont of Sogatella furcifera]|uniref:lysylphosphatidylglycerol synthase transmembrane domain-containing protein n=1 Tax=Cardinium endosymbiont of Sogatella furcifera TaxID=650378 RepID=UPI000E0D39C2|nr:lysylphosphatidylglycerol synthase transmembrane domain-containing protein [Cardinium endosymbiont of Sogatella furcifera]AXI24042.1 Lysylphosphatidylglycerol synthase TM region [Cardinium endosymbiont of Sogatella furcifera]
MDAQEALKTLNVKKVWFPIICGLAITGFLFYRSGKISLEVITLLSAPNWYYLFMTLLAIVLREVGHMYRLRILSNHTLSWTSCFYVTILWEFGTAVTPSVVGGGLVAIFLLSKEGLSFGRSIAYVIVTGIVDNLFFLLAGSFGLGGAYDSIFVIAGQLSSGIKAFFFSTYAFFFLYNLVMTIGVFVNPKPLKWILMRITSIGFLKRWRRSAYQLSKDIIVTSHEFRGRFPIFWSKILLCTLLTWMVRYVLMNCLMAAYCPISFGQHLAIWGRQIVMWALMLLPVSPGGSGIAEFWFQKFFEPMLGDYTLLIALLWRICTFYLYLVLGAILLPKWIHRVFTSKLP